MNKIRKFNLFCFLCKQLLMQVKKYNMLGDLVSRLRNHIKNKQYIIDILTQQNFELQEHILLAEPKSQEVNQLLHRIEMQKSQLRKFQEKDAEILRELGSSSQQNQEVQQLKDSNFKLSEKYCQQEDIICQQKSTIEALQQENRLVRLMVQRQGKLIKQGTCNDVDIKDMQLSKNQIQNEPFSDYLTQQLDELTHQFQQELRSKNEQLLMLRSQLSGSIYHDNPTDLADFSDTQIQVFHEQDVTAQPIVKVESELERRMAEINSIRKQEEELDAQSVKVQLLASREEVKSLEKQMEMQRRDFDAQLEGLIGERNLLLQEQSYRFGGNAIGDVDHQE